MNRTDERISQEYLVFELAGRRYGLPAADVREIVRVVRIAPLPGAPAVIEGIINVRGRVVPVLDIRKRLGLEAKALEHVDHLIIAGIGDRLTALRVDRALGMMPINEGDMEDLRGIATNKQGIRWIAKIMDDLVLIPDDLRKLLSDADVNALEDALPTAPSGPGAGGCR
jgi:purine-binding chemotaxis protein CheW